jgi:2-polyprenyl-6-methoxyphenol hydroxylase-like FAD-dependent oxidoreductase
MVGLHLLPRDAGHLVTSPGAWQGAFEETRHISAAFPKLKFEFPLRALDASGGQLSQFAGDRWLAFGDAAMSFDPISAQGIFSALHSGMMAAATVHKSLEGDHEAVEVYQTRLEEIRRIYVARCQSYLPVPTPLARQQLLVALKTT